MNRLGDIRARGAVPPGPSADLSLTEIRRDPLRFIMDVTRQYGDIVRYSVGGWKATLVNHPAGVRHILHDHQSLYSKEGTPDLMMLKPMLGEGLLTSEGRPWRLQRRMLQPVFHRQQIEAFGNLITETTQSMLARWERHAATAQALEIVEEMTHLTLRIVAKALFNYDVSQETEVFGKSVAVLNETMGHFNPGDQEVLTRFREALGTIRQIVNQVISERRFSDPGAADVLSLLLLAHDEESGYRMNDKQVSDQTLTLLLAGHETTAKTLGWTLYLLSEHSEVAERLHDEVHSVLGERVAAVDDLAHLPYTLMVIQEAMRLYPPIWLMSRVAIEDDEIGGYHIPARSLVTISPYVMHRHPSFWNDPERFEPERFAPERESQRLQFSYFPFSGGARQCIGKHFALVEAHLVLASIAQRFNLKLVAGHPVEPEALVTLRPHRGLPMTLHPLS